MGIEETIKVTGAAEGKRELDQLSEGMKGVGDQSEKAGKKGEAAGEKIGEAGEKTSQFGGALGRLTGGLSALAAIKSLWDGIVESQREAIRLQDEFTGKAVDLAAQAKAFSGQIDVGEEDSVRILTELRRAGGFGLQKAVALGTAADIAFDSSGGLLAGQNFKTAKEIAAFAGAKNFSAGATESLFGFLKTAGALDSPEAAKEATAKISAAATSSKAKDVGGFVNLLNRGGTDLLQQGVSLQDVLELAGQARQVEVTEELAAQSLLTVNRVASFGQSEKFTKEILRVAKEQGLDSSKLSSAQKVQITRDILGGVGEDQEEQDRVAALLSPEQAGRLLKAFRGSNIADTIGIGQEAASATAADFDAIVEKNRDSIVRRKNINDAEIAFLEFGIGNEKFTISQARVLGDAQLRSDQALRIAVVDPKTREADLENKVVEVLQKQIDELRGEGAHVELAQDAIDFLGFANPLTGFADEALDDVAKEIDAARTVLRTGGNAPRASDRRARRLKTARSLVELIQNNPEDFSNVNTNVFFPGFQAIADFFKNNRDISPQNVNVTNIGTQYNDVEAGRHPPEDEDLND